MILSNGAIVRDLLDLKLRVESFGGSPESFKSALKDLCPYQFGDYLPLQ